MQRCIAGKEGSAFFMRDKQEFHSSTTCVLSLIAAATTVITYGQGQTFALVRDFSGRLLQILWNKTPSKSYSHKQCPPFIP